MKNWFSLMLLVIGLAIGQATFGQEEPLTIDGPTEAIPGQLVRLTATMNPEESAFWIVLSPGDLDYEQVDSGRKLIFAVDCKEPRPIVVMLLAQAVRNGRLETRQVRRKIKINDDYESPPEPLPVVPPEKPIADEPSRSPLYDTVSVELAKMAYSARERRTQVAANFENIAAQCPGFGNGVRARGCL